MANRVTINNPEHPSWGQPFPECHPHHRVTGLMMLSQNSHTRSTGPLCALVDEGTEDRGLSSASPCIQR